MQRTLERLAQWPNVRIDVRTIGIVVGTKLAVLLLGGLVVQWFGRQRLQTAREWLEIWNLWDAPHYLDLAAYGYQNTDPLRRWLVFYPLYPWLTRLFGWPFNDYLVGAFLVSTIASLIAGALFYQLVRIDEEPRVAALSVWFLVIYPTAYILHIGYTESLFLALLFGCLLAARNDKWLLAGLLGACASLTRVNGLLLLPVLGAEALHQWWLTRRWRWSWLWIGLVVTGFAGYLLLNYRVAGDPFAFSKIVKQYWYKSFTWPWVGLTATFGSIPNRLPREIWAIFVPEIIFVVLSLIGTIASCFLLRPAYSVWMATNWLLFTSTSFILSVPRYTLLLFPLTILLAKVAQRRLWLVVISLVSLAGLVLFASLFLLQVGGY